MARKRMTDIEAQYFRERTRIQRFLRSAKKRGYIFPDSILPNIPKKITEGSVRRLKSYTPKYLYSKSVGFFNNGAIIDSGKGRNIERARATEKRAKTIQVKKQNAKTLQVQEQKPKSKGVREKYYNTEKTQVPDAPGSPAAFEYNVLEEMKEKISSWTPLSYWTPSLIEAKTKDKETLSGILESAIQTYGEEAVADRLQKQASIVTHLTDEILYGSGTKEGNFRDGRTTVNADLSAIASILKGGPLTPEEAMYWGGMQDYMEVVN